MQTSFLESLLAYPWAFATCPSTLVKEKSQAHTRLEKRICVWDLEPKYGRKCRK